MYESLHVAGVPIAPVFFTFIYFIFLETRIIGFNFAAGSLGLYIHSNSSGGLRKKIFYNQKILVPIESAYMQLPIGPSYTYLAPFRDIAGFWCS